MRRVFFLVVPLAVVVALAGCAPRVDTDQDAETFAPQTTGSPEGAMEEGGNSVRFVNVGTQAIAGRPMDVVWQVTPSETPLTVVHTAVHYDTVSRPGDFGPEVTPAASEYKSLTKPFVNEELTGPRSFTDQLTPAAGTLYLRAHAIIGGKNYWTAEEQIEVAASAADVGSGDNIIKKPEGAMVEKKEGIMAGAKTFTMTAKQWEFSPATITVKQGDKVKLTIKSVDVKHGFLLPEYKIDEKLEPGQTVTVEFTADKTGEFTFRCNVLCGSGHPTMVGKLIVQ